MALVNRPLPRITQDVDFEFRSLGHQPSITQDIDFTGLKDGPFRPVNVVFHNITDIQGPSHVIKGPASCTPPLPARGAKISDTSLGSDEEDVGLIKRPPGSAGRPNSGGFNLETAVGWPSERFAKLQKYVHAKCSEMLDTAVSYLNQDPEAVEAVCSAAMVKFPTLGQYEASWPVKELLKMKLKATSEKGRNLGDKEIMDELLETLGTRVSRAPVTRKRKPSERDSDSGEGPSSKKPKQT